MDLDRWRSREDLGGFGGGNHNQNILYEKKVYLKKVRKKEKLDKNYIVECTSVEVTSMALETDLSMLRS